jgi:hypothetical protein
MSALFLDCGENAMNKALKSATLVCAAGLFAGGMAGAASAAMRGGPGIGGAPHPAMTGGAPHAAMVHTAHAGHGPVFHGHHRFRRGFVFGVGDGYYGDYYGGCGYYRVRWRETGRRYWRARYLDCVNG